MRSQLASSSLGIGTRRPRVNPLVMAMAAASLFTLSAAQAQTALPVLPTGPSVVRGQAQLVTNQNTMRVTNSNNSILNWRSFSIGAGGKVEFVQPNAQSQVLNRVTGNDPSQIFGSLQSNGKVWLLNPNGVLFGQGARVDVAGLVASTLNVSNDDWLAGRHVLTNTLVGRDGAPVVNQGELRTTLGGRIALIAGRGDVSNEGLISAPGGQVLLAAGNSVDIVDTGAPNITLRVTAPQGRVVNLGEISARGGRVDVQAAIVNQQGLMSADALGTGAGGEVVLRASSSLALGGDSVTSADGGSSGRGGSIVAQGDGSTQFRGALRARGGSAAGDGGSIETAGGLLDAQQLRVDASAANGQAGTWVARGANIVIADRAPLVLSAAALPPAVPMVSAASIEAALGNGTHVRIVADGSGALLGNVGMVGVSLSPVLRRAAQLSLEAKNSITVANSSIANDADGAALGLRIDAPVALLTTSSINVGGRVEVAADRLVLLTVGDAFTSFASSAAGDAIVVHGRNGDGLSAFFNNSTRDVFSAPEGRFLVYAASPTASGTATLRNLPYAFSQHGASFANRNTVNGNIATPLPGNGLLFAAAPSALQLSGTPTKTYDGNTAGTLARDAVSVSAGLPAGERAVFADGVRGNYDSRNAGARTFTLAPGAVGFVDAQGRPVFGYENSLGTLQGRITPAALTLRGVNVADKVYDGTTNAQFTSASFNGLVGNEQLGVSASAVFADANAGAGKAVTGSVSALTDGANGGLASNYVSRGGSFSTTASITPAPLTLVATVADKVYDSTTAAQITALSFSGLVGSEQLGISASAAFADANAGVGKLVAGTVGALSNGANGGLASNYTLRGAGFTTTASISPALLTVLNASVADKVYDSTTAAQITSLALSGLVGSEQLGASATAAFADANAGAGKRVDGTVSALADGANGGLARNYTLAGGAFTTNANIARAPLTVLRGAAADKVYDATTGAQITAVDLGGLVGNQQLGVSAVGQFIDANAATGKQVNGSVASLTDGANGGLASNYALSGSTFSTRATISPAPLTVQSASAADKVYDATTGARITALTLGGLVGNQQLGVSAAGTFADANAQASKPVNGTVTALADGANGGLASNYTLPTNSFTTSASISPATLVYQANAITLKLPLPVLNLSGTVSGFVGTDTLQSATTGTMTFTAPPAATAVPGVYGVQGTGLAAANYAFVQAPANTTALTVQPEPVVKGVTELNPKLIPILQQPIVGLERGGDAVALTPSVSTPTTGRALDVSQWLQINAADGSSTFRSVPVNALSQESLASLLSARERYKERVFAEAIGQLEREPGLADAPDCKTPQQVETGTCLITETLKREMAVRSGVTQAEASPAASATPTPTAKPAATQASQVTAATVAEPLASFSTKRRIKAATLPQIERKIALLIGVDDYSDARIPKLANAAGDARAVGELLESQLGYETVVLANASKAQIIRTLNTLAATLGAKDSVVVYYAGHGQLVSGTGLGYWQVGDADASDAKSWLSNADIGKLISRLGASQVALVSDSCFSGSLVSQERIRPQASGVDAGALLSRRAAVVMSSGGNEPVFDDGKNGHSPFAFSLMQALQGVPTWQAGGNVFERVRFAVAKELPQRPRYGAALAGGHEAGSDYVFERRELESR